MYHSVIEEKENPLGENRREMILFVQCTNKVKEPEFWLSYINLN